jgi:ABC-type glycerol-3-phosphate transport system substrate-binding protein
MQCMRVLRAVAAALLLAAGVAACSGDSSSSLPTPSKAFCQAAYDYDTNLPKLIGKINKQTDLVAKLAETAPKDIADDAQVYLDAMKRRAAGDTSVIDNPKIERAVDNVNRRASDGCELFKQNQDGSGGI